MSGRWTLITDLNMPEMSGFELLSVFGEVFLRDSGSRPVSLHVHHRPPGVIAAYMQKARDRYYAKDRGVRYKKKIISKILKK